MSINSAVTRFIPLTEIKNPADEIQAKWYKLSSQIQLGAGLASNSGLVRAPKCKYFLVSRPIKFRRFFKISLFPFFLCAHRTFWLSGQAESEHAYRPD